MNFKKLSNGYVLLNILLREVRASLLTEPVKIFEYQKSVTIYDNYPD